MQGLGHDIVDIAACKQQLEEPHSTFAQLFSVREQRQVMVRAAQKHDDVAVHYAGKWAAKEAFIKAWCMALDRAAVSYPYTIESLPWSQIEVLTNTHGVPEIVCSGAVEQMFMRTMSTISSGISHILVSVSHDGNVASAVVILE